MGYRWPALISNHLSYFSYGVLSRAVADRGLMVERSSASNYQTEGELLRKRWRWMRQRFRAAHSVAEVSNGSQKPVAGFAGGIVAAMGRWLYSLFIEQIDHVGGWVDQGNNLMLVARKTR